MNAGEPSGPEIFVIDDDPAVRQVLTTVFTVAGYRVICFADGRALLSTARNRTPACIILDVHIPGQSGLDILKELNAEDYPSPVLIISGRGDIAMAVGAIKGGAYDFIEKPFLGSAIVSRVRDAIDAYAKRKTTPLNPAVAQLNFPGREPLTRREREVLNQLVVGASNKEVGRQLGIGTRTVEFHRARLMEKLGARNIAELIRVATTGESIQPRRDS
jgi:FixJ family two-component response regulator